MLRLLVYIIYYIYIIYSIINIQEETTKKGDLLSTHQGNTLNAFFQYTQR